MGLKTFVAAAVLIVVVGGIFLARINFSGMSGISGQVQQPAQSNTTQSKLTNEVSYSCDNGKSIAAAYYEGPAQPAPRPGEPPVPSGSVQLLFNDKTTITLKQTLSADGGRYANADESFVFWSKGNGAIVMQNGAEKDYTNCVIADAVRPAASTTAGSSTQ